MSFKQGWRLRGRFGLITLLALGIAAAVAVPLAFANTATPTTSHSTWSYVSGNSGPIDVTVAGDWNWPTQSCAQGGKSGGVSHTDVKGHYAIGFAGSWNDSTTPNTLTGKATNGQSVTLHVGDKMDQSIVDYCANATSSSPLPTGTFSITHRYASLADFQADVPNGEVCVNAYDIHQQSKTDDWNPGKNGDNTLQAHQYVLGAMCSTSRPATLKPGLRLVKLEHVGSADSYVRGPVSGRAGQTVYYKMVVTNTGNTTLDVTLSDPRCDAGTLSPASTVTMAPGDTAVWYCSHVLSKSDAPVFTNVATASGQSASAKSTVVAKAKARTVLGSVKGVRHRARPARPVVKPASFTG